MCQFVFLQHRKKWGNPYGQHRSSGIKRVVSGREEEELARLRCNSAEKRDAEGDKLGCFANCFRRIKKTSS